jgi:hypothetical protein
LRGNVLVHGLEVGLGRHGFQSSGAGSGLFRRLSSIRILGIISRGIHVSPRYLNWPDQGEFWSMMDGWRAGGISGVGHEPGGSVRRRQAGPYGCLDGAEQHRASVTADIVIVRG